MGITFLNKLVMNNQVMMITFQMMSNLVMKKLLVL